MHAENPPFPRGETVDAATGCFDHLVGREWWVADEVPAAGSSGTRQARTNRLVRIKLVKNGAAVALLPKRLARFASTDYGQTIDGYVATTAQDYAGVIDEHLPSAGVPASYYCYVVTAGPTLCLLPLAGADFNGDVAVGDRLVGLTAATSQATTAGRIAKENITGSTQTSDYSFIHNNLANFVGRALTARTTQNTTGGSTLNELLVQVVDRW